MGRSRSNSRNSSKSRENSRSRSRTKSASRSRSRSRSAADKRKERSVDRRSRSHSRGHSRSRSRSPRHGGGGSRHSKYNRDNPPPSKCVGVFNLSPYTSEKDLRDVFGEFGEIDRVDLVYDRPSGHSRGFGFVYYFDVHDATAARDKLSNTELDGHKIRVDYSFTKRGHSPTPGQYMGDRYERERGRGDRGRDSYRDRDRHRSPDRRRFGGGSGGGGSRRAYDPSNRRRVESYANGVSSRRRSRS